MMPKKYDRDTTAYTQLSKKFLLHKSFEVALDGVLDALSLHDASDSDQPCLQMTGPTGVGKSTLLKKLKDAYVPELDGRRIAVPGCPDIVVDHIPLLVFDMPSKPSVVTVCQEGLMRLGDPAYFKGDRANLERRFDAAVKAAGTIGIVIDDAQRAVDRNGMVVKDDLVDWLKDRQRVTRCIMVFVGLGRLRHLFVKDGQIKRRFDAPIRLLPYRWADEHGNELFDEQADIIGIFDALQRSSPIKFADAVTVRSGETENEDAILRFFYGSRGVIGLFMKLLKMVFRIARREEREHLPIDMELLGRAYEKAFTEDDSSWLNPFLPGWSPYLDAEKTKPHLPPPLEDDTLLLNPPPRRRRSKAKVNADIRHVLSLGG